jgi:hypothetical protein
MKTWMKAFLFVAAFDLVVGTIYWFVTNEWTGTVMVLFMAAFPIIVVAWTVQQGGLRGVRPEDDDHADPAGRTELIGEFPSATAWPLVLVLGVFVLVLAIVYGMILSPFAIGLIGWALVGFIRESRV